MTDAIVRIGGVVRPEPDPEQQLAHIASVTGEDEFSEWMRDYKAGGWMLVCLELFAEGLGGDGVTRFCDSRVHSLSFVVPHAQENVDHACEVVADHLDTLAGMLNDHDIEANPGDLAQLPVAIELAPEIRKRLAA
jgi:hypothetical protein